MCELSIIQGNEGIIFTEVRFSLGYSWHTDCFEQLVFNQVTAAIHMTHSVKNLGDKLIYVHSVGQNNVCPENNRSHKETNAGTYKSHPKQVLTYTYNILQQLVGLAPQQQLLVLRMKMEMIYIHSLILQVCLLLFENFCLTMFMLIFLGLSFLHVL